MVALRDLAQAPNLRMAQDQTAAAVREFREALDGYRRAEIPYEVARTRAVLAQALLREGDRMGAVMELQAARGMFARLGASPDLRGSERLLEEMQSP